MIVGSQTIHLEYTSPRTLAQPTTLTVSLTPLGHWAYRPHRMKGQLK